MIARTDEALEVSIVICTRNRAHLLDGTLDALAAIRSERRWEVLLIDNASTDGTSARIARADDCGGRLRLHHVPAIGLGAARDAGWRLTRGALIAFTDDDCYPEPDYVDAIAAVFARDPDLAAFGGRILLHDPDDLRVTVDERDEPETLPVKRFVDAGVLHGANLAFRRATLERIGGFDPALGAGTAFPCEDIDVVARTLWDAGPVRFEPSAVVWHHHRRRESDIDRLFEGYDRGRGAYYAKFLLRRDTRIAYLRGWWAIARRHDERHDLRRFRREIRALVAYLGRRRAWGLLAVALPVASAVGTTIAARVALAFVRRRTRALAARRRGVGVDIDGAERPGRLERPLHLGPDLVRLRGRHGHETVPDRHAIPAGARGLDAAGDPIITG